MLNIREEFEKHNDDYLEFDRVENPLHPRPDVCAFLLLERLAPMSPERGHDLIMWAGHDVFLLGTDTEALAAAATPEDILMLVRCGVHYSSEHDCLAMFT